MDVASRTGPVHFFSGREHKNSREINQNKNQLIPGPTGGLREVRFT